MTLMEHSVRSTQDEPFNPLVEFAGAWTTQLADEFEPYLVRRFNKWESIHGRLIVAPAEASNNSWGEVRLSHLMDREARRAGMFVYLSLNILLSPDTWLQPDLNVLNRIPAGRTRKKWVPVDHFTMSIEFVSPSLKEQDEVIKPELMAGAGVPYYLRVHINPDQRSVEITQFKLIDGAYREIAHAGEGVFTMTEPFELSFDVADLLEPEPDERDR
jgi:Putative restriction endonuclease